MYTFFQTISFLLPALQQLLQREHLERDTIHMLVLSPTRELAAQIDDEAQKLTNNKKNKQQAMMIRHQVIFGGSSRPKDVAQFERHVPTILVATPGRLSQYMIFYLYYSVFLLYLSFFNIFFIISPPVSYIPSEY